MPRAPASLKSARLSSALAKLPLSYDTVVVGEVKRRGMIMVWTVVMVVL